MTDSARKAVVRDLPPTLPAEVFWKAVEPWVRTEPETARTAKHTSYVQGKRAEQPGVGAIAPTADHAGNPALSRAMTRHR